MKKISQALMNQIESRIKSLESEDKYIKDFIFDVGQGGGAGSTEETDQLGVTVPRYFGQLNTFIANPQSVGVGLLSRMAETDPTILSSLQFKTMMMLSKIGEYQHEDDEIADFVRAFLSRMDGPTWEESMEAQSSFGGYGFSISEILWGINSTNQKIPRSVKTYHPSTLCFEVDPYGDITPDGIIQFVIQNTQYSNPNAYFPLFNNGFQLKSSFDTPTDRLTPYRLPFINNYGIARIPKTKVVHHVSNSQMSFGSPYGKTAVRTAHMAWQLKVFFLKQMGIAAKRNAQPFVWATAPMNVIQVKTTLPDGTTLQANPIATLTEILANRESFDSVVTGPESAGYKLQSIANSADLNQYLAVLQWLDTQIFRAFLLPSLVMTDGSAGSRSLGDKHFQVVDRIAEGEAQKFGKTIINQLIRQAIEMNFGEQEDYGHFAARPQNIEERERLANMFVNLANGGFMQSQNEKDGEFVRSSLHLPDQDESFYNQAMPNFDPLESDETDQPSDKSEASDEEDKPAPPAPHSEDGETGLSQGLMGVRKEVPYNNHKIIIWQDSNLYSWSVEKNGTVKGKSKPIYADPDSAVGGAKTFLDQIH